MSNIKIRYIVDDLDEAIEFYTQVLDFKVVMNPAPGFAALERDNLRLLLNVPGAGGAGQAMPDGTKPEPGGWNRFQLEVEDLETTVNEMKKQDANFRNDITNGKGGKQILMEDPSGNLIELFESYRL